MSGPDRDEVDRRFAELVRTEFGEEPPSGHRGDEPSPPRRRHRPDEPPSTAGPEAVGGAGEPPSPDDVPPKVAAPRAPAPQARRFGATWSDDSEPPGGEDGWGEDVDYRTVEAPPHTWPTAVVVGFVLALGGVLAALVVLLGGRSSAWVVWLAVGSMVAGVGLLMVVALRRRPGDGEEPGARI